MGARDNLQKLLERKAAEVESLECALRDARIYLQAIRDSIKALPKESVSADIVEYKSLRPGTDMAKTQELIKTAGRPLHITEILEGLGKPLSKSNRVSLSGSLAGYARAHRIFSKPAPNTFGLMEMSEHFRLESSEEEIPPDFGKF